MTTCDEFSAVHLLEIPDSAPPFDGSSPAARGLATPEPAAVRAAAEVARAGVAENAGTSATSGAVAGVTGGPGTDAAGGGWPAQFARLLAEVLAGHRPARQLAPWTTERVRLRIRRLAPAFSAGQQPRVLRIHASQPAAGIVEMSVVIGLGARRRALALRLERAARGGRPAAWLCTDIEAA